MNGGMRLYSIDGTYNAFLITNNVVINVTGSSYAIATSTISTISIKGRSSENGVTVACQPVLAITVIPLPATGMLA
jgi:hypothetical protein